MAGFEILRPEAWSVGRNDSYEFLCRPVEIDTEDLSIPTRVETREIRVEEVGAILDHLTSIGNSRTGRGYAFGFYFDPELGKVAISGDLPETAVRDLEIRFGSHVVYRASRGGRFSRQNDGPPHWGGAWINGDGPCTSGFGVHKANGVKYMVTAQHCADLGTPVTGGTGLNWGTVVQEAFAPQFDLALIGNGQYGRSIYTGGAAGTGQTVTGAADPVVGGTSYCLSGRTTNETCGHHVETLNGAMCDVGCTAPVIMFRDGIKPQPGDSGAPFFNYPAAGKRTIRGLFIGGWPDQNEYYAEKWSRVVDRFGVIINT